MMKKEATRSKDSNPRVRRKNRRDEMLLAAEKLLQLNGLTGVTTRLIAETVGCSEGALYVHFRGRTDLLVTVLDRALSEMRIPFEELRRSVGKGTPRKNLERAASGVFSFHQRVVSMLSALFAEPSLLAEFRNHLVSQNRGPQLAISTLQDYILGEQELGRIDLGIDAQMAATSLVAASFFRAFTQAFFEQRGEPPLREFISRLVGSVLGLHSKKK
jgi:AcrR family transcriptional regulator